MFCESRNRYPDTITKTIQTMDIQLNFINQSNDQNNSQIVIFQKNVATSFDEVAVAWKVIQNCGQGENHPFVYSLQTGVSAGDPYGNFSQPLPSTEGSRFDMVLTPSGDQLRPSNQQATASNEIEVYNGLDKGAISAYVHRSGSVCAVKTGIAPGQKAIFEFKPTIWVGVVSQVQEGEVMDSAIISQVNTEISLLGITKANIIMTGGGVGSTATPFKFSLENVEMA